jgi:hypothetical protein
LQRNFSRDPDIPHLQEDRAEKPPRTARLGGNSGAVRKVSDALCKASDTNAKGAGVFAPTPLALSNPTLVRMKRLELSLRLRNSDLNAARLPIPPHPHLGLALDARYLAIVAWVEKGHFAGSAS